MAVFSTEAIDFFQRTKRSVGSRMPFMHFHNHHELYFLESGRTTYLIGNEVYFLEPGDFAFIPQGIYHQTDNSESVNIERILMVFDDDFAGRDYRKYLDMLTEIKHIQIRPEELYRFRTLFRSMEEECHTHPEEYKEMQKLFLRQLFILISRYRQKKEPAPVSETCRIIQDATRYISTNYGQPLTLDFLARKYAISPGYFSKLFKKITGVGLNDYITVSRITAAQNRLAQKGAKVTQVAMECGFNDSAYFSKIFRKITDATPKEYQKRVLSADTAHKK